MSAEDLPLGTPDGPTAARKRVTRLQGAPEPIAALNRVRIREYTLPWQEREPLVDIRRACPGVVVSEWVCPYLRATVAEMLNRAQALLPTGYRFKVGTALRTLAMQAAGWDSYFKRMCEEHPQWPLSARRRATNKYFAPYDQKAPPGHCTGGAVDVGLLDPEGKDVDVTSPTKGWEAAYTWSDKLSQEAKANRMLLVEAMLEAGFSNCRDEYWHYSYGDSAWAVRVGEAECPYGWAHPPVRLEAGFDAASLGDASVETIRDVNGRAIQAMAACGPAAGADRAPSGDPVWRAGLYWANGVPVTIRVCGLSRPEIYACADLKPKESAPEWAPVAEVDATAGIVTISLTPTADRIWLANCPPPPPAAPATEGAEQPA